MKQRLKHFWVLIFVSCLIGQLASVVHSDEPARHAATASVHFSPRGGAQEAIIREIDSAQKSILIQAYSFTSAPIAKAVMEAHKRGVKVEAVLDRSNQTARYSSATFLQNQGIPVFIDHQPAIAHSKVMIIDGVTLITGSFNFSRAAEERNVENVLVIKESPGLIAAYEEHFRKRHAESRAYEKLVPASERAFQLPTTADEDDKPDDAGEKVAPQLRQLDINSASAKELESLPGIGKVTSQRIVAYRTQQGGFKSIEELMRVSGIGQKTFDILRPLVTVTAKE